MNGRAVVRVSIGAIALWLMGGCTSNYNARTQPMYSMYRTGNYPQAAQGYSSLATDASKQDQVVLGLEAGTALHAAGDQAASAKAFESAEDEIRVYDDEPDVKVSEETEAALVNQTVMDYRGYACDKIMLDTYDALDYLELGEMDKARVKLRRAQERQREAVEKHKKQIDADQQAAKDHNTDVNQTLNDPTFKSTLDQQYADLNAQDMTAYQDYVNPFTEYLHGLFLTYAGEDNADVSDGAAALRKTAELIGNNDYVKADAVLADQIANGKHVNPMTYVIYEAGVAPLREQISFNVPLYVWTSNGIHGATFSAAFPILRTQACDCPVADVEVGSVSYPTQVVCDMDKVIIQEFKNELPGIITRTLISAAIKIGVQVAANESGNQIVEVAGLIGTAVYTVVTNAADLRAWKTLPKTISVARFETPTSRDIDINIAGRPVTVHLNDGVVNVVYVKCTEAGTPPVIRQFKLR